MAGPLQTSPSTSSAQRPRGLQGAAGPGLLQMGIVNGRPRGIADAYHFLLNLSWPAFIGIVVAGYVAANLIYATIYTLIPDSINGSTGFVDNFFFSVQTWATIGYGGMTPKGILANSVVVVESMTGIFGVALLTGLFFAKFARPEARVMFAKKATISMYNGKPTLMIRLANERGSQIIEAEAHLTLIREEASAEGHKMRRIYDLGLVRATQPLFRLSWTVMHVIDAHSPLFGYDAARLNADGVRLFMNLVGYDASVGQTTHASAGYGADDIVFGGRYKDATRDDGNRMVLDFALFHDTEPAPLPPGPLGAPPASPSS